MTWPRAAGLTVVAEFREALMAMFDRFVIHLGVPGGLGPETGEGWIEGAIGERGPSVPEERPRPLVVREALGRVEDGGGPRWVWALLQGPIMVAEMRTPGRASRGE